MRVLDLFSSLRGWSDPFRARGHEVFCVELSEKFPADHRDVFDYEPPGGGYFDIVLASPVCTGFSVMQIGRNWTHDHQPKTDRARLSLAMVERTRYIIAKAKPRFFVIENPRAKLRKLPVVADLERRTVTYCQYGEKRMKPTDLWGGFPPSLVLKKPCLNGMPCHTSAPRGSTTGTQGMDSAESAKIPAALALAVCLAAEADMNNWSVPTPDPQGELPL